MNAEMTKDQKQRSAKGWVWWIPVLFLLSYPLSLGPAFWIGARFRHADRACGMLTPIYFPVIIAVLKCPEPARHVFASYMCLGAPRDVSVHFINNGPADMGMITTHPGYTYTWLFY